VGAVVGAAEAYARQKAADMAVVNMRQTISGTLSLVAHRAGAFGLGFGTLFGSMCYLGSLHDNKPRPMDYALSGVLSGFLLTLCVANKDRFKCSMWRGLQLGGALWLLGTVEGQPLPNATYTANKAEYHSKARREYLQDKEEKKAAEQL